MNTQTLDVRFRQMAVDDAAEWMEDIISAFERGARDLKARQKQLQQIAANQQDKSLASPMQIIEWAVNDVFNVQMNLHLQRGCHHAATLAKFFDRS